MHLRRAAIGVGFLLFLACPPAWADSTTDAAALKQFDAGRAAYDKGDLVTALASFNESLRALPSPNTRLYIARCQRGLGKIGSAYTSYQLAAHEAADRLNATGEKRYGATRDTAQAEGAEIEKSVPHLTVKMPVDAPPGTTSVRVDDAVMQTSSLESLDVDPGPHTVRVTAPRRTPFEEKITIALGETKTVTVNLPRMPTATIQIALASKPAGVAVELDGKPLDSTATGAQEVDAGAHRVIVRAPGYNDFEWKGQLADGDSRTVDVALKPGVSSTESHGTPKWLFFGVAGAAIVALGVGTYFALDASSRADDEKAKDPLVRSPSERDSIGSEATTANVLFIAGAAVAAGAGALFFLTDWRGGRASSPKAGRTIEPLLGLGGAGVRGSF
jgi:hypothetical protein